MQSNHGKCSISLLDLPSCVESSNCKGRVPMIHWIVLQDYASAQNPDVNRQDARTASQIHDEILH